LTWGQYFLIIKVEVDKISAGGKRDKEMQDLFQNFGRMLIFIGLILLIIGFLLGNIGKIPFLGKLPGDILIQKKNFTFYFPITTCIVLSILLTLILSFICRK